MKVGDFLPTLTDIQSQLLPGDRLIVIADNCDDDTAELARGGGVEVIERHEPTKRGKGYALDFGLRHLAADPPDIVIVVDADCRLQNGTIHQLALTAAATGRPVQALNVMTSPAESPINHRVAEFAGRVKRWLRPLGLSALGLPCQLSGTGMAFPYEVVQTADLTSGSIAEDVKLGLELSMAGYPPTFCPSACVISEFPSSVKGTTTQRQRWEHGHIHLIAKDALQFFSKAIVHRNWDLLVLTLDLIVPPLSLLGLLIAVVFVVTSVAALLGTSPAAATISAISILGFVGAMFLPGYTAGATSCLLARLGR